MEPERRPWRVIAPELRSLARERFESLSRFAAALAIRRETLSRWLNGKRPPSFDAVLRMSRLLGLSWHDLLYGGSASDVAARLNRLERAVSAALREDPAPPALALVPPHEAAAGSGASPPPLLLALSAERFLWLLRHAPHLRFRGFPLTHPVGLTRGLLSCRVGSPESS